MWLFIANFLKLLKIFLSYSDMLVNISPLRKKNTGVHKPTQIYYKFYWYKEYLELNLQIRIKDTTILL